MLWMKQTVRKNKGMTIHLFKEGFSKEMTLKDFTPHSAHIPLAHDKLQGPYTAKKVGKFSM